MKFFGDDLHFPRPAPGPLWEPLRDAYLREPRKMLEQPFDLRAAVFHSTDRRVSDGQLKEWRTDLYSWATDHGFPQKLDGTTRSDWDVDLGVRLWADTGHLPEATHPDVWCWIAIHLLPHFVVYRWGWPTSDTDEAPIGAAKWSRFGRDLRNGLRLAVHRVRTYGEDLARLASEQEFQSIQYRPAYGLDQRVARVILETLVESYTDKDSNYGKNGGNRALDCNDVCIELRVVSSMRPLCFASDLEIAATVRSVIDRLPELRRTKESTI
jgi:hypothetical protein